MKKKLLVPLMPPCRRYLLLASLLCCFFRPKKGPRRSVRRGPAGRRGRCPAAAAAEGGAIDAMGSNVDRKKGLVSQQR